MSSNHHLLLIVIQFLWAPSLTHSRSHLLIYKNIQMKDQMIAEQIDVIIIGAKALDLIQLIFGSSLSTTSEKEQNPYLVKLNKILGKDIGIRESEKTLQKEKGLGKINKFTKSLITQSFWLQFHFFVHSLHIYDPLISSMAGGNISICIMVNDQETSQTSDLKKLITKQGQSDLIKDYERANQQKNSRDQTMMQAKIFDILHNMKINEFSSLLSLKIMNGNRIIEESSNLRLSINQILRWIVDRYFENKFRIRLKGELGDEIENYTQPVEEQYCKMI